MEIETMENTAVFIGHRYLPDEAALAPAVRAAVRRLLAAGYRRFLCGGCGSFDRLCAEILWDMKTGMPGVESILVHPYPRNHFPQSVCRYFDTVLYPGLEDVPPRYAIPRRNRWMVEQSQAALCHVTHDWGGAYQTLAYARRRGLQIYNV